MKTNVQKILAPIGVGLFFTLSIISTAGAQVATTTDGSNTTTVENRDRIRNWRGQSSDTQNKINALPSSAVQDVALPVLFGTKPLKSDFGDPRSNGRTHIGHDIMAVKGSPIVSPTQAVVIRIGVGAGEGNYVSTANPGGETFVYMHLDRFAEGLTEGMILEKGALIGYVGNTGNAIGGGAHLHFEIHDSNRVALDPFTRLTGTFTLQEKINYLSRILSMSTDSNALAQLLVANYRPTFNQAVSSGIVLPEIIRNYMASLPMTPPTSGSSLPNGELALGSKGLDVIKLQQYLIAKGTGPAAVRLSQAGATGNFGYMTQTALIEYQISMNISPADGYYGGVTKTKVETNPIVTNPVVPSPSGSTILTRDLSLNSVGEDVHMLQRYLNQHGYIVAQVGAGSPGNETTYFGLATRAAVIKFQMSKGISPAVGYVGPITRQTISTTP